MGTVPSFRHQKKCMIDKWWLRYCCFVFSPSLGFVNVSKLTDSERNCSADKDSDNRKTYERTFLRHMHMANLYIMGHFIYTIMKRNYFICIPIILWDWWEIDTKSYVFPCFPQYRYGIYLLSWMIVFPNHMVILILSYSFPRGLITMVTSLHFKIFNLVIFNFRENYYTFHEILCRNICKTCA